MPDLQNPQEPQPSNTNGQSQQPPTPAAPVPPTPVQPTPISAGTPSPPTIPASPAVPSGGNNSGMGSGSEVPPGVDGWGWGPFYFIGLWGIFNNVWIALLAWIPIFPIGLIMAIVLGINGRKWAWQNKKWDNVEHFNRVQRRWSLWAIGLIVAVILSIILVTIVVAISGFNSGFNSGGFSGTIESDYRSTNSQVREAGVAVTDCIEDQVSKGTPTSTIYSDTELDLVTKKGGCANSSNLLRGGYISSISSAVKIKKTTSKICVYKETIGSSGYASYDSSEGVVATAPNGTSTCR